MRYMICYSLHVYTFVKISLKYLECTVFLTQQFAMLFYCLTEVILNIFLLFLSSGLRRSELQTDVRISSRLSFQCSHNKIQDSLLPSECRRTWQHLSRYTQGEMVSRPKCTFNASFNTKFIRR